MILPLSPILVALALAWGAFAAMWLGAAPLVVVVAFGIIAALGTAGLVFVIWDEFS